MAQIETYLTHQAETGPLVPPKGDHWEWQLVYPGDCLYNTVTTRPPEPIPGLWVLWQRARLPADAAARATPGSPGYQPGQEERIRRMAARP